MKLEIANFRKQISQADYLINFLGPKITIPIKIVFLNSILERNFNP